MIAQHLDPRDRVVAARVVRVRAAVPVDAGRGQARDQLLALPADHGGLPVRARLRRIVRDLSESRWPWAQADQWASSRQYSLPRSSPAPRSTPHGRCCRRVCVCAASRYFFTAAGLGLAVAGGAARTLLRRSAAVARFRVRVRHAAQIHRAPLASAPGARRRRRR